MDGVDTDVVENTQTNLASGSNYSKAVDAITSDVSMSMSVGSNTETEATGDDSNSSINHF